MIFDNIGNSTLITEIAGKSMLKRANMNGNEPTCC